MPTPSSHNRGPQGSLWCRPRVWRACPVGSGDDLPLRHVWRPATRDSDVPIGLTEVRQSEQASGQVVTAGIP